MTQKCHERAEHMYWDVFRACMLPIGHEGSHQGGGDCFAHGEYVGKQCPRWPDCEGELLTKELAGAILQKAGN